MKLILAIRKNRIAEWFVALMFIIPYLERGKIIDFLSYQSDTTNWSAILTFEVFLLLFLLFYTRIHLIKYSTDRMVSWRIVLFVVYLVFNLIYALFMGGKPLPALNYALMFCLPLINASLVWRIITAKRLSISGIVRKSVFIYTAFVAFTIVYNVVAFGMSLVMGAQNTWRMTASAGGVVTLGYMIAFVTVFMFANRSVFTYKELWTCFFIQSMGIFYTQARGAIFILIIVMMYQLLSTKNKAYIIVGGIIASFLILMLRFEDILKIIMPRSMSLESISEDARVMTLINCLKAICREPQYTFLGYGVNNFFPYQIWEMTTDPMEVFINQNFNMFYHLGYKILVQPHNTFLYIFMETGIVGLALFVNIIIGFMRAGLKKGKNKLTVLFVLLCFTFLSCVESTLLLQPGIACAWWLIIMITLNSCRISKETE